jgi:hypothetical protein
MMQGGIKPGIIILREGTDTSQVSAIGIFEIFKSNKGNLFFCVCPF